MKNKETLLGKNIKNLGLEALVGSLNNDSSLNRHSANKVIAKNIDVNKLVPNAYQPRKIFDPDKMEELSKSIKQHGILQPILVRKIKGQESDDITYEIIAGERRWRAAQLAELSEIPALIYEIDDQTTATLALIENIQREDLNVVDKALSLQRLVNEFNLTHQKVSEMTGWSRSTISNFIRLLALDPFIISLLQNGDLDMGHARALLCLEEDEQKKVAKIIIAKSLSVRATEEFIANKRNNNLSNNKIYMKDSTEMRIQHLEHRLKSSLNFVYARIKHTNSGKGSLVLKYNDLDELENIIANIAQKNYEQEQTNF